MRLTPRLFQPASPCVRYAVLQCLALCGSLWASMALAQEPSDPLALQPSPVLSEALSPQQRREAPVFLQGDQISGRSDLETVVQGDAVMRKADTVIHADRLEYDQPTDQARAIGHVRINRAGNLYEGPLLELKVERFEGFFQQPVYHFANGDAHGEAARAEFQDENHTVVFDATYTTCRRLPGPSWMPDWVLRAASISLDNDEEVGVANGAYLYFKGVPILPVPAISFPLTEKRKSGLLPPTFGIDNISGTTLAMPYYWNIAPNLDATLTPTLMTSRGVDLGVTLRYLEPSYNGRVVADSMPGDKLRGLDRWGLAWTHNATINSGLPNISPVGLALNINRVSDDNYWRDFTSSEAFLTQRLLPADALASWSSGPVSGTVHVLKWQILQDPASPIVPPYDRLPQLTAHTGQSNVQGFDWALDGDFTQFEADRVLTGQPNAQRTFALAQISRPWLAPQGFITPKLQLHAAAYQFDGLLADGSQSATSVVPTFSLDSGLVFERESTFLGRNYVQTLEPRAFYVYTPFRNQSNLPNYDTGVADFNFASIYSENAFVGHDKISDNNLLTLGLTTRFLDPDSGSQYARFGIAQRLRFDPQQVTINSAASPAQSGLSDVLLGAEVNLNDRWTLDSTTQYNPLTDQSVRATVGARYNPGSYRVFNAAYRYQRAFSEQIDLSWQWPINDLWGDRGRDMGAGRGQGEGRYYALGRTNYSMDQGKLIDTLLGVEYDAGCWLGRVVFSRTQTSTSTAVERWIFQLEFVGFTRLGTADPRATLTQNISRYQNLRDAGGASKSRFSNFE
ncbi:LPS-assembly protein LptD [Rhodoferax lacus]|uniref:LPS-assembly protein LptD n=1 Tax=Rhodoferax lacus TaxID=2184758 RepID=A0A3E1RB67_9BURK|nr:LPS assembly protein LptD [Rhodoferax lacus]RFO96461.1 LPS-assembly protein LptD [Rhodoferax lacus]